MWRRRVITRSARAEFCRAHPSQGWRRKWSDGALYMSVADEKRYRRRRRKATVAEAMVDVYESLLALYPELTTARVVKGGKKQ